MSNLKSLLLQMKLDDNYEMRVIAEEEIVNSYEKLQQENGKLLNRIHELVKENFDLSVQLEEMFFVKTPVL